MRKQSDEMKHLASLKSKKELLSQEIQEQEQRIAQLRKTLGYSRKP